MIWKLAPTVAQWIASINALARALMSLVKGSLGQSMLASKLFTSFFYI